MKKRLVVGLMGLVVTVLLVSCGSFPKMSDTVTSFEVSQVSTGNATAERQRLEDFEITVPVKQYIGIPAGPALIRNEDIDTLVRSMIDAEIARQGGTQAVNVSISNEARMTDFMLNGLTAFIYAPSTVRISGTVVK